MKICNAALKKGGFAQIAGGIVQTQTRNGGAMTAAMAPRDHEASQLLGLAAHVVNADPAVAVPLRQLWLQGLVALDIMLLDFDEEAYEMSTLMQRAFHAVRQIMHHTLPRINAFCPEVGITANGWRFQC